MGGEQSTRRVTVDLDANDPSTVKISSDVLQRLKSNIGSYPEQAPPTSTSQAPPIPIQQPPRYAKFEDQHEVERLEKLYKRRLNDLEKLNDELHKSSKENFNQAVQEVESKFLHQTFSPVCQEKQKLVLDCYRENHGKPLLCSDQVNDFLACVNQTRAKVLSRNG